MSRTFKYLGPFDEVEIAATGQVVQRGHQVTIDDPEVAAGLDGQDTWEHVPKPTKKSVTKTADTEGGAAATERA